MVYDTGFIVSATALGPPPDQRSEDAARPNTGHAGCGGERPGGEATTPLPTIGVEGQFELQAASCLVSEIPRIHAASLGDNANVHASRYRVASATRCPASKR